MPRPIWTGTISFGLVAVPVKLFTATEDRDVRFHELQRDSGERIRHKRVAEDSGEEVAYDDIVKGYEASPGEHVIVEPEELEEIDPGQARTIEVEDFIHLDDVDPVYFQKTYHLMPVDEGASRPYRLLHQAMRDAGRAAIGRFVMRGKPHLAAVRPAGDVLVLETMFFADEVRDPTRLDEMALLDDGKPPSQRELKAAGELIESLTTDWDPQSYRDTHREQVLEVVQRKAEGEEIVTEDEAEPAPVIDLMEALEKSLEQTRGRGGARRDYDSMSKEELYEEAQRRGIDGRSTMSRDELASALRRAS
jgi:DNA end-binding protein Ku